MTQPTTITNELITFVCARLAQDKQVRRVLPQDGRLCIDRQVPFLCIYRRPSGRSDEGTSQLVVGQASYLIATDDRIFHRSLSALVSDIVKTLAQEFGVFLLVEIWASTDSIPTNDSDSQHLAYQPAFRIVTHTRPNDPLTRTIAHMERSLKRIRLAQQSARVEIVEVAQHSKTTPPGLHPLLSALEAKTLNCRMVGLDVQPVYRDCETGGLFPLTLQALHQSMTRALKQTFFEFVRTQTSHHLAHYHSLGRRAMVKAVWSIDRQLADISDSFDFLLHVTPTNSASAWSTFKRTQFQKEPVFYYRPLPVDPVLLKRHLFKIPLERIEDPTLANLFLEKQRELDRQISMLLDRGTRHFRYGSLQIFGGVDKDLMDMAESLLHHLPPRSRDDSHRGYLNARAFAERAIDEIAYYRQTCATFTGEVQVRDDINTGLMVSQGTLLIGKQTKVPVTRVDALLHHEVGTHMVTYFNGQSQPFRQLHTGLAGYEELQEGLAVLAEYLGGNLSRPRLRILAARVIAAHCMLEDASFIDTFRLLDTTYGFDQHTAFTVTMRIYRGGGLTKDAIYLRGLLHVLDYLRKGGDLTPLFVGKIAAAHIPIVRELQLRGILHPIPVQPRYMCNDTIHARLERLRQGLSVWDLVEKK